jgi:PAS domain S-box-containing protein
LLVERVMEALEGVAQDSLIQIEGQSLEVRVAPIGELRYVTWGEPWRRDQSTQFHLVLNNIDEVMVVARDNKVLWVSANVERLWGLPRANVTGADMQPWCAAPYDNTIDVLRRRLQVEASGSDHERVPLRPDAGPPRWMEARLAQVAFFADQKMADVIVFRDVHEEVLLETGLRQSEQRYRVVVENSLDLIIECDFNCMIRWASPSLARTLSVPSGEALATERALKTVQAMARVYRLSRRS